MTVLWKLKFQKKKKRKKKKETRFWRACRLQAPSGRLTLAKQTQGLEAFILPLPAKGTRMVQVLGTGVCGPIRLLLLHAQGNLWSFRTPTHPMLGKCLSLSEELTECPWGQKYPLCFSWRWALW